MSPRVSQTSAAPPQGHVHMTTAFFAAERTLSVSQTHESGLMKKELFLVKETVPDVLPKDSRDFKRRGWKDGGGMAM